jgi:hypothetical protein
MNLLWLITGVTYTVLMLLIVGWFFKKGVSILKSLRGQDVMRGEDKVVPHPANQAEVVGRRKEEGGGGRRRKEEGGRRKEEGGRRTEEGGRRKEEGGRRGSGREGGDQTNHPDYQAYLDVRLWQHHLLLPPPDPCHGPLLPTPDFCCHIFFYLFFPPMDFVGPAHDICAQTKKMKKIVEGKIPERFSLFPILFCKFW